MAWQNKTMEIIGEKQYGKSKFRVDTLPCLWQQNPRCLPYGSNVSPIKYILSFGSVGHILSKTEKATHCPLVTYAAKPEKQISIIE